MKKTPFFRILAGLCCSFFLLVSLNFDGCKSSQPAAPIMSQDTNKFVLSGANITFSIHGIINDTTNGYMFASENIVNRKCDSISTMSVYQVCYDSSFYGGACQAYDYTTIRKSIVLSVDPTQHVFKKINIHLTNNHECDDPYSGGTFHNTGYEEYITLKDVSFTTNANGFQTVDIRGEDIRLHLNTLSYSNGSSAHDGRGHNENNVTRISSLAKVLTNSDSIKIIIRQ
jgi:hypothetical protein